MALGPQRRIPYVSPTQQALQIVQPQQVARTGRKMRTPSHPFSLITRPYQLQPFLLAPVLPGETMKNLLMQSRVVTDPLSPAMKLVGWWTEYYFFYVKITDLDDHAAIIDMLINGTSLSGLASAADTATYHKGDGVNFTQLCLNRVVQEYFRDDDETTAPLLDGLPMIAATQNDGIFDSLILDSATADHEDELPGVNPGVPANMSSQWSDTFNHWEAMRGLQLTEATFEDWLRTYGVKAPREEREDLRRPELIRYVRDWKYPSNTVNPEDGSVTGAVSWSVAERADKDRFLQIPGFIFGVTVSRPKVFLGNQDAAAGHYLDDAYSWLPALLHQDPYTSARKFAADKGPAVDIMSAAYWVDMRDLFVHGDQFLNYDPVSGGTHPAGMVDLPKADGGRKYAAATAIDAFFANASPANRVRQDGRVDLSILSVVSEDTSL